MDGVSYGGREEQCSICKVPVPAGSIVKVQASNLRSAVTMASGEVWFWGGYFYEGYHKLLIANFNLLQEEEGLRDKQII
jgi:hypothetical protein